MMEFTNLTKKRLPRLPWEKAEKLVLGKKYNLSVVLAGNALMRGLNKQRRGKNKPANVLSFALSKNEGEIFINLSSAPNGEKGKEEILRLFIHSLLHLKGFSHSDKMEAEEDKIIKKFK